MAITILLADDHNMVRQGLRFLLESQPNLQVVGEASDGLEALQKIQKLHPQVTVLDLMMPSLGGLEVTRQVQGITKVVILSMHANEAYVLEAMRNGALGYVLKDSTAADLIQAVEAAAEGRRYLSAPLSDRAIDVYLQKSKTLPQDPYDTLTNREREVLQLVAQGLSTSEVSTRLTISPRTVEIHRANLMHKLTLRSQADLIRYALRKGIVPLDKET